MLTDGRNEATGGPTLDALLTRIAATPEREIRVVTIAYGANADRAVLARIAQASKGAAYVAATPEDIGRIYGEAMAKL